MDLDKYPIDELEADELLNRLTEECSELIHAIAKRKRFGESSIHPRTGETANQRVVAEFNDVKQIMKEVEVRLDNDGSFYPISDNETWYGWN